MSVDWEQQLCPRIMKSLGGKRSSQVSKQESSFLFVRISLVTQKVRIESKVTRGEDNDGPWRASWFLDQEVPSKTRLKGKRLEASLYRPSSLSVLLYRDLHVFFTVTVCPWLLQTLLTLDTFAL